MRKFEAPKMDVVNFQVMDIITTSTDCDGYQKCGNDMGEF